MKKQVIDKTPKKAEKPTTKTNTLSPKVAKADELRIITLKAHKKMAGIVSKWTGELTNCSSKERASVNEKYQQKFAEADAAENVAYANYYGYVADNFTKSQVSEALNPHLGKGKKGFMGKDFIVDLEKTSTKRK